MACRIENLGIKVWRGQNDKFVIRSMSSRAKEKFCSTEKIILWIFATVMSQGKSKFYLPTVYPLGFTLYTINMNSNIKLVNLVHWLYYFL